MPILKPEQLVTPWSRWSALSRDKGVDGVGSDDGYLTIDELKNQLTNLAAERAKALEDGLSVFYLDMQIGESRKLYNDMVASGATALQYLPDDLMNMPEHLRRRAVELLRQDDVTTIGTIDQYVIDHARGRYGAMTAFTPGMMASKQKALDEISEIAAWLGLS